MRDSLEEGDWKHRYPQYCPGLSGPPRAEKQKVFRSRSLRLEFQYRLWRELGKRMELKKHSPVNLRSIGYDERWLQAQIKADSSLLGLGALDIVGKEHPVPSG